jgi:hypothetical protein
MSKLLVSIYICIHNRQPYKNFHGTNVLVSTSLIDTVNSYQQWNAAIRAAIRATGTINLAPKLEFDISVIHSSEETFKLAEAALSDLIERRYDRTDGTRRDIYQHLSGAHSVTIGSVTVHPFFLVFRPFWSSEASENTVLLTDTTCESYKQSSATGTSHLKFLFWLKVPELNVSRCVITSSVPIASSEVSTTSYSPQIHRPTLSRNDRSNPL